ncbi:MAG: ABC transporter ATP-binding protein [Bacteroidota bacterium]
MILANNIHKTYGKNSALKGIALHIKKGECYGLLGPNGAGKTTAIGILSTLIPMDKGSAEINGYDVKSSPTDCKKSIGVVPQEIALYEELSGYENLRFWGSLYGLQPNLLAQRIDAILHQVGLTGRKHEKIKTYSGGMKRRVNIAAALLHKPQVLFMDEPTVGIDPQSRNLIFEIVEELREEGMTLVYTTHYMEEAERLCDRIGIIDDGKIIAEGSVKELKTLTKDGEGANITFVHLSDKTYQLLQTKATRRIGNSVHFYTPKIQEELVEIILKCTRIGLEIRQVDIIKSNLESIFLGLTGKKLRDI